MAAEYKSIRRSAAKSLSSSKGFARLFKLTPLFDCTMGSTQVGIIRDLARYPPQDPAARKDLYNAALDLLYSVESSQDTAQRLYHGVSAFRG